MKRLKCLNYLKAGGLFGVLLAGASPQAWSQAAPAKLVALWDFNDASAPTLSKDVLRGITGTNMATTEFTADAGGRSGLAGDRAIDLKTAGNNFVRVPTGGFINFAAADDDMTVTFWEKLYRVVASSSFWMASPSSPSTSRGFQAHVPWSDSTIYFDSAGCCGADTRINLNIADFPGYTGDAGFWTNWHHFAFVKNGPVKEIWIDGQLFHSGSEAIPLPSDFTELTIGATVGGGNYVRGQLDDFAVWGSALDGGQIGQLAGGSAPASLVVDTDGDGMPDWWEDQFALNKNTNDGAQDADSDGSNNLAEYRRLTDPKQADSDGDGLKDGVETGTGVWVSATDTGTNPLNQDSDSDGLGDAIETNSGTFVNAGNPGTDPTKADTDGDGFSDSVEARFGGNPLLASSGPVPATLTKLLAYWDFNTTSDPEKTIDKVFGITGYVTNGAAFTTGRTDSPTDSSISFGSAAGTTVFVPEGGFMNIASASNTMTVSFWQRLDEVAATSSLWGESVSSGGRGINLHNPWSDSTIYFDTGGADGATRVNRNISGLPGYDEATWDWSAWHHFAFVKNGDTKEIWVDGKMLVRGTNTRRLASDFTRLWIGSQPNGGAPVRGQLDDVAVFASALDESRIRELAGGKAPNAIETLTDTDSDGLPDIWETENGTNKNANDASQDPDSDGLTNLQEFQRKTNPQVADTDGDGLKDGVETGTGTWVSATDTGSSPLRPDSDGDGLGDAAETGTGTYVSATNAGSDPNKADTDGDGIPDGVEVALETSPVNAGASPVKAGEPNLLAYWDFNSLTGDNVNDKIHGFVGVLTNGAALGGAASGRSGQAADQNIDFGPDSANQAIWVTNGVFLNAGAAVDRMSVSFWQKLYDVAASSAFWIVSPSRANRGYQGHTPWSDSTIYFDTAGCCDGGVHRINANISTLPGYDEATWDWTAWHHFAFVKNGPVKQVWIDGKLLVEGAGIALPTDFTTMMIGAEPPNAANSIHGMLDDFAVFASALVPAQITELAGGKAPTEIKGVPVATLSLSRQAGKWVLTFTGTLESSDTLQTGSWTAVANATSGMELTATAAHRFYRARN